MSAKYIMYKGEKYVRVDAKVKVEGEKYKNPEAIKKYIKELLISIGIRDNKIQNIAQNEVFKLVNNFKDLGDKVVTDDRAKKLIKDKFKEFVNKNFKYEMRELESGVKKRGFTFKQTGDFFINESGLK